MSFPQPNPTGPLTNDPDERTEPRLATRALATNERTGRDGNGGFARSLRRLRSAQFRQPGKPRLPRIVARRVALGLSIVFVILLIAVVTSALLLRHAMRAALPQIDGQIHTAGLSAPVTVERNAQGVPNLQASTLDDLLFAQGFVTAGDRLWQMDALRRHAAGELAEILGPSLVEHDRTQRYLQIGAAADRALRQLPPEELHQLEAYARGVNAYIGTAGDHLPLEFHLLHYKPAPWSPRDSLLVSLVMYQDLSTGFPVKLDREALSGHLSAQLLADLYPSGSWRDRPPTQLPTDLTAPREEVEQIPLDRSQVRDRRPTRPFTQPDELLRVDAMLGNADCTDCRSGSNNWAVAASRSASGFPLLSNDMHLNLAAPDIWYEAALHVAGGTEPAFDVAGFTLPGVPFVIVGRNAHVAWGFTSMVADVQDVRIEHLRGSGPNTEFEHSDGTWSLAIHHTEAIRVRGGRDVSLDVLATTHSGGANVIETPIISPLFPSERRALSLSWTAYDPASVRSPFFEVNSARDGSALVAALASFGGPSLNLVYADDARHIGYHALGRIPIRGPAVKRPRAVEPLILPTEPADPDGDESGGPDAALRLPGIQTDGGATLLPAAYVRRSRRRARVATPRTKPETAPVRPAGESIPVPPPVLDYTVGSPLATVPVDALDASQDWSDYIPYSDLPAAIDPANGILATANARITPDNYPYAIANDWVDPYRVERIHKLLDERTGLTAADMLAVQIDVHSEFDLLLAQKLAYAVDHASTGALGKSARRLHAAADLLRVWDGTMSANAPAPAIVSAVRDELWPMLLAAQVRARDGAAVSPRTAGELAKLYRWNERNSALEELLQHTPARWLPRSYASWNDFLAAVLSRGLDDAHAPADLSRWKYGDTHHIEIAHPVLGSHSWMGRLLGVATGSGPQPIGGDANTVRATGAHFGPSERFTSDLANADATTANITTGESGNPRSPWYLDQFEPWLMGTTFPLPLQPGGARHTLTLLPQ